VLVLKIVIKNNIVLNFVDLFFVLYGRGVTVNRFYLLIYLMPPIRFHASCLVTKRK